MFTLSFWKALVERSVFTFAEVLVSMIAIGETDLLHFQWVTALSVSGMAALAAALKCFIVAGATRNGPGLGGQEELKL